ncbi:MAG: TolC family protein [Gemmatimonadaceae bacterium]
MHSPIRLCVLVFFASTASAQQPATQAYTQADTLVLTRARAVQLALTRNPQLEVAREQTAEFRALKVQAVAIPDPAVTAGLDQQSGFFRNLPGGQRNIGAVLAVPFPDKIRLRGRVASADVTNSSAAYHALRYTIAAQTAVMYDSLLLATRQRADISQSRQLSQQFLQRTQARFDAGTAPRLDVIKAQVDVAQAENQLIANERDIAAAQGGLNRLVGRTVGAPIVAGDSLGIPPPLPRFEVVTALAVASRSELAGLKAEREGAKAATSLAHEFWLPDITLGVNRDVTPGAPPSAFSTGLAFPVPFLFWQHTRGEIAQAQHRERELAASYRDLYAQIGQDVRNAYATANTTLRQAIFIRDVLLPSAREAFRAASASYAIGGSSAFEVIDARRTLLDAESQYSLALAAANTAQSDLERAVGAPIDTTADTTAPGQTHAQ